LLPGRARRIKGSGGREAVKFSVSRQLDGETANF